MPDTGAHVYVFGSLSGHWTAFALFSAIAIFCGFAATRIARQRAAPSSELPFYGTTRLARRLIGAVLAATLLLVIWMWLWSGFHELAISSGTVTLQYHVPPRQRVLAREEIVSVGWQAGPRFSRLFVIQTRNGARLSSMQTSVSDDDARSIAESIRLGLGLTGT